MYIFAKNATTLTSNYASTFSNFSKDHTFQYILYCQILGWNLKEEDKTKCMSTNTDIKSFRQDFVILGTTMSLLFCSVNNLKVLTMYIQKSNSRKILLVIVFSVPWILLRKSPSLLLHLNGTAGQDQLCYMHYSWCSKHLQNKDKFQECF